MPSRSASTSPETGPVAPRRYTRISSAGAPILALSYRMPPSTATGGALAEHQVARRLPWRGRRPTHAFREWDVERTLEAHAGAAAVLGVLLGAAVDRRLFYLQAIVGAFLVLHAVE